MKKSILFITDLENGEEEDIITIDYLKKYFQVTISYFSNMEKIEDNFDLIVVRNAWPSDASKIKTYHKLNEAFLKRAKLKKLKVYNDLNANCDHRGKDYIIKLYKDSLPVIPTIDSIKDIHLLPKVNQYIIKPKEGFDSRGVRTIQRKNLLKMKLNDYLIQPKINFKYEISFYFIDKKFLYCLIFEPSKIPKWPKPKYHKPTSKELQFAKKFINSDKLRFGVCRVDALMTKDGNLLMLEIEDDSPYFSITEIDEKLKNRFLKKITSSIKKILI